VTVYGVLTPFALELPRRPEPPETEPAVKPGVEERPAVVPPVDVPEPLRDPPPLLTEPPPPPRPPPPPPPPRRRVSSMSERASCSE
jgi:hypothetical protein